MAFPIYLLILIFSVFLSCESFAKYEFSYSDKFRILSEKGFRHTRENKFEAVGNVVIINGPTTLYGDEATLFFNSGEMVINGQVRFLAPDISLFGESLEYQF